MLQQLRERYRRYDEEATQVRKKAAPADGLFGFGNDPKNHPCHEQFYEDVGKWTKEFLETQPSPGDSLDAARFLIEAPRTCAGAGSWCADWTRKGAPSCGRCTMNCTPNGTECRYIRSCTRP